MSIKRAVKAIIPSSVLKMIRDRRAKNAFEEYRTLSTQEVFTKIYNESVWGKSDDPSRAFYSGGGSHHKHFVSDYIEAVQGFLSTFEEKPDVVDLGCGDFYVGSNIRGFCRSYVACDIVPALIEAMKVEYKDLGVDFRVLDLTSDELPAGDVVFIRQVLQHLSNDQILRALPGICAKYKYLVLTEHLPAAPDFKHNLDKLAGPHIRMVVDSGIVLTSPPFNLEAKSERCLCQVGDATGVVRTTLYQLLD